MAKLRRINRGRLAELVLEKAKQWKVDKMDNGSVAGIDQMVEEITALLQQSSDSASPEPKLVKTDYDPCPWWTTELHLLRRQLNVERNRLKKHPNNIACAIRVKILKREYRKLIRVEKRKVKIRLAEQAKDAWKILRRLNSKNVMTGVMKGAASGAHSAKLLFDCFFPKSVVSGEKQKDFVEQLGDDLKKLDPVSKSFVNFTDKEVRDVIISLGCFKSPGPDGIPGVALHCTVDVLMPFWLKLFNP